MGKAPLSGRLRIYLLRFIVISSLSWIVLSIWTSITPPFSETHQWDWYTLVALFTAFHHLATITTWRWFYGIMDSVLVSLEVFGISYTIKIRATSISANMTIVSLVYQVTLYVNLGFLVLCWILRVADIISSRGQMLWYPYSIFGYSDYPDVLPTPSPYSMLLGKTIWRPAFKGESWVSQLLRGVVAGGLLALAVLFTFVEIILYPIREGEFIRTRGYRAAFTPGITEPSIYSIVAYIDGSSFFINSSMTEDLSSLLPLADSLKAAVNVTAFWNMSSPSVGTPCSHTPGQYYSDGGYGDSNMGIDTDNPLPNNQYVAYNSMLAITILCPDPTNTTDYGPAENEIQKLVYPYNSPHMLVTVNFSSFDFASSVSNNNAVSIFVGLTKDIGDVLVGTTDPAVLFPGNRLIGLTRRSFRQRFSNQASIPWLDSKPSRTFVVADFKQILYDQYPLTSPSPDTAAISVRFHNDMLFSGWPIIQDYTGTSVSDGLSRVGGFWASLNSVVMVIFGGTLLFILLGSRPLSPFGGIVYKFQPERILKMVEDEYPALAADLDKEKPKSERGLLTLLRDHMLDVEPLVKSSPASANGEAYSELANLINRRDTETGIDMEDRPTDVGR